MQTRSSRSTSKRKQKNINKDKHDILQTNSSPVKELVWVIWLTLFILVFLSLISWSSDDVGWFQVTSKTEPSNLLGRAGASISDFLIFCFGMSSYWWAVLFASLSLSSFRKSSVLRENAKVGRSNISKVGWMMKLMMKTQIFMLIAPFQSRVGLYYFYRAVLLLKHKG